MYGLWQLLARPGRLDGRAFGRAVWDLARAMLPGMLLAVILVLPVVVLQYHSDAFQFVADPEAFGFEPMELAYCLFFGRYSAACAADGMPYLYIGSAALLLALCYFLGGDSTRAKFAAAALAAGGWRPATCWNCPASAGRTATTWRCFRSGTGFCSAPCW